MLAVIGGAGMFMVAKHRQSTTYIAERSVIISHRINESQLNRENNQDPIINADLNMMQTYTDIVQDEQVAQAAKKYLPKKIRKQYSANEISHDVDAISHPQSLVMKIRVKSDNKDNSVVLVNAVARGLKEELSHLQPGAGNVKLLAKATTDNVDSNTTPNKKKFVAMGLALGGLLGIVISFVAITWKKYVVK
ncbi:YveK family protein [Limosilactobacillus reuteri]|uniref:chain-length determining protein n=1 Tax=Limosilactobacillus reuteri TaxID=1598 RepID=UPI00298C069F|nr:chain-length determining protein [Limosilactobacillus reuteri]